MGYALTAAGIAALSAVGAFLLVGRYGRGQDRAVKAVFFGLYFWGLVFLQIIFYAFGYGVIKN